MKKIKDFTEETQTPVSKRKFKGRLVFICLSSFVLGWVGQNLSMLKEQGVTWRSLIPLQISNEIGQTPLIERPNDEPPLSVIYNTKKVIAPSIDTLNHPLLEQVFDYVKTEDEALLQEQKQELIDSLLEINESADYIVHSSVYRFFIKFLPLDLLQLMEKDGLRFILSDSSPKSAENSHLSEENWMTLAYYQPQSNQIVFSNHLNAPEAIFHEIGHWFEFYIKKNIDYFCLSRMSEQMIHELQNLGLAPNYLEHVSQDKHEAFATFFECLFTNYESFYRVAPIAHDYLLYYLDETFKLNEF